MRAVYLKYQIHCEQDLSDLRPPVGDHAVRLLGILLREAHLLQQLCLFLSRYNTILA